MRRILIIILGVVSLMVCVPRVGAQIISVKGERLDADSLKRAFGDEHFYFGLYKDNYFIFGPTLGSKITKKNTNLKFQISIAQKLTKNTLPWGTYLYLYYTQKCFWNILENSMPMTDLNFNPGIGLAKQLFVKGHYIGKVEFIVEHESNGRDSIWSRSWNKISLAGSVLLDPNIVVFGKVWIPLVDGKENKDILHYTGIYHFGFSFYSQNRKFSATLMMVRRTGAFFNYNTVIEAAYRFSRRHNQYLFAQYYNGYGEGLLAYKEYHSVLRVGFVIKPTFFSEF